MCKTCQNIKEHSGASIQFATFLDAKFFSFRHCHGFKSVAVVIGMTVVVFLLLFFFLFNSPQRGIKLITQKLQLHQESVSLQALNVSILSDIIIIVYFSRYVLMYRKECEMTDQPTQIQNYL